MCFHCKFTKFPVVVVTATKSFSSDWGEVYRHISWKKIYITPSRVIHNISVVTCLQLEIAADDEVVHFPAVKQNRKNITYSSKNKYWLLAPYFRYQFYGIPCEICGTNYIVNNDVCNRVADCSVIVINLITYSRFYLRFSSRVDSKSSVLFLWQIKTIKNSNCCLRTIISSRNRSVNVEVISFPDDEDKKVFIELKTLRILKMAYITHRNSFGIHVS
jgi:hypothetical protein